VNGATYGFRVCAVDLAGNVSAGSTAIVRPAPEYRSPIGAIVIADGAPFVGSTITKLALDASDASGVTEMCVSNTSTCTAWRPYEASIAWTLTSGSGAKTVSVWFRDPYNNLSAVATDQVTVDLVAPKDGTLVATPAAGRIALGWSGWVDTGSGLHSYRLVVSATETPSCATSAVLYTGTGTTFVHGGLEPHTTYRYRLCGVDGAGNLSAGTTASATTP
jgi:hypothetical protein